MPEYADLTTVPSPIDRATPDDIESRGLSDSDIISILDSWETASISTRMDGVSRDRATALEYYNLEPYGNEQKNWSKFVTSETFDSVEWLKTELLKIFTSAKDIVEFLPEGAEDVESAKQKTKYCNYVFFRRNNGFEILYTMIHDALLQKNSIVKVYPEKKPRPPIENYIGVTEEQISMLNEQGEIIDLRPSASSPQFYDAVFQPRDEGYNIIIECIAPEDFYVNADHKSLSVMDADFVQHRSKMSVSALREREIVGLDEELPGAGIDEDDYNEEEQARDEDIDDFGRYTQPLDPSMRRVVVKDCTVKIDVDRDGIAERRRIIRIGQRVYLNEAVNFVGYACFSAMPQAHRWLGKSEADLTMPIQLISSELQRQTLNNVYLSNHMRPIVKEGASGPLVNLDSLMTAGPGEPIFEKEAGALRFEGPGFIANDLLAVKENILEQLQSRTGILGQKVDADVISRTAAGGAVASVIAAETGDSRVQGIARVLAETALKDVFKLIVQIARQYQNVPQEFRLGNEVVTVDPREWTSFADVHANIGLGSGAHARNAQTIASIIDQQTQAAQGGGLNVLVTPKNLYNSLSMYAELSGFKDASVFWTDPDTVQPPEPGPSDQDKLLAAQLQVEELKARMRASEIQKDLLVAKMNNKNDLEIAALKARVDLRADGGANHRMIMKPEGVPEKPQKSGPRTIRGRVGGKPFEVTIGDG